MTDAELMDAARGVRARAHAPYSGFRVGAVILDEHGQVHLGCNVENAAYPQGACAEAVAIGVMVSCGGTRIAAIAVAGGHDAPVPCAPCGGCRQRIREFADSATRIVLLGEDGGIEVSDIEALLPRSFGPGDLARGR